MTGDVSDVAEKLTDLRDFCQGYARQRSSGDLRDHTGPPVVSLSRAADFDEDGVGSPASVVRPSPASLPSRCKIECVQMLYLVRVDFHCCLRTCLHLESLERGALV